MNWYLAALKKYAVFDGRARQKEFWYFFLFDILILAVLTIVDRLRGTFSREFSLGLYSGLYMLAVMIPRLAVTVRRLHDTNRSGWWLLLLFVPVGGAILVLVFCALDSQPGENQYGPNPKQG
ncbi:MAG: DUF805 domain-containing protein [Terriglobia bacterium]